MTAMPSTRPRTRILLSVAATASGVLLLLSLKPHSTAGAVAASAPGTALPGTIAPASPDPSSGGGSGSAATRTVDGDAVQTRYGPVQLRVTLADGKITGVTVLQVPSSNPRDREITDFAVPQLTQEALAAQNANIDTVSGATYTSEGYAQSLQSALDKAGG
jgi:uncharacterized protein with FMN-binding domain